MLKKKKSNNKTKFITLDQRDDQNSAKYKNYVQEYSEK